MQMSVGLSSLMFSCALGLVMSACSGGTGDQGGNTDPVRGGVAPGSETAPPPSTPPSRPTSTGETCREGKDCANWFCQCADGAVVNSAFCYNGACQTPENHCPRACETFRHGAWTGRVGGGPQPPSSCAITGLQLGQNACVTCLKDKCCGALQTCDRDAECLAWDRCTTDCNGDQACRDACSAAHPSGEDRYMQIYNCAASSCPSTCL